MNAIGMCSAATRTRNRTQPSWFFQLVQPPVFVHDICARLCLNSRHIFAGAVRLAPRSTPESYLRPLSDDVGCRGVSQPTYVLTANRRIRYVSLCVPKTVHSTHSSELLSLLTEIIEGQWLSACYFPPDALAPGIERITVRTDLPGDRNLIHYDSRSQNSQRQN